MILKNLFLNLNIELIDKDAINYRYSFNKKTKHICNYIERNCLKLLKFNSDSFQAIGIDLRYGYEEKFMNLKPFISPNKSLVIVKTFDKVKYDSLKTDSEFRAFVYDYLYSALTDSSINYSIPSNEILESFKELKEKNFVNKWLFKKKTDKVNKIIAELHCSLSIDKFELSLKVTQDKKEIYNEVILETVPDEVVFQSQFNNLKIESNKIIILGKRDKLFKEFTFKQLGIS